MAHLPQLIEDLALILLAAGVFTLLFKRLKQPQVLGYLIAGFLVGPHFPLFPTVTDTDSIETWAEIGVIFLMFSLGLEFSFKKLARVGGPAGITAIVEVAGMLLLGYLAGRVLGWSNMDSLFLGGILSISSTTIILRAFGELGVKQQPFARLVFGTLIVEDLVAILLLVLLSTLATGGFQGGAVLNSLLRLGFFIVLWFISGIYLIPTALRIARPWMNGETLLIVSVALCMGMVILCTGAGFSAPLGAFMMGSILAETRDAEKIEHLTEPLKNLFGAIFFVSVGMLIDPGVLVHYWVPILIITGVTLVGKFLTSGLGALLSGQSLETSVRTGLSLAQIGEFSFIIATLGLQLKVTSPFLYPIAVAVSALTTFATPYLIRAGAGMKERPGPAPLPAAPWRAVGQRFLMLLLVNGVLLVAIVWLLRRTSLHPYVIAGLTLVLSSPFLWALAFRKASFSKVKTAEGGTFPIAIDILRVLAAAIFVVVVLDLCFPTWIALVAALLFLAGIYFLFAGRLERVYRRIEDRFLENLGERKEN
jgi:CPA2 family monovalent cation:H+ antiporter-2